MKWGEGGGEIFGNVLGVAGGGAVEDVQRCHYLFVVDFMIYDCEQR